MFQSPLARFGAADVALGWGSRTVFAPPRRGFQIGAEPYQRVSNIVKQRIPWGLWGLLTRHQDVIDAGQAMLGQELAGRFPEPPLGPVALDRLSHLLAGREPHPDDALLVVPAAALNQDKPPPSPRALAYEQELGAFGEL
jgi:hypothetical protein